MRIALALFMALGTLGSLSAGAVSSGILVQGFSINNQILVELYNNASQSNQQITTWPSNMNPAVIQATVRNPGSTALRPCFVAVIKETTSGCPGGDVVVSPMVKSRVEIQPGETRVLTAADFETSGSYSGSICQAFQDQLENEFEGGDVSQINKIVDKFMKRSFQICLVEVDCNSGVQIGGNQACTSFTLLSGAPGGAASVAMLVFPHNNEVEAGGLNFLWTPALHPQLSSGEISYLLEVLEGADGQVLARIEVPAGQTYYQWSPSDKDLEPGKQYYWRVIARNARTRATFGGQDGRGWNIQKWFRIKGKGAAAGPCSYTLQDLEDFVRDHATPEVKALIKDMKAKALTSPLSFTDQDICALLNGKADLKAINATKK